MVYKLKHPCSFLLLNLFHPSQIQQNEMFINLQSERIFHSSQLSPDLAARAESAASPMGFSRAEMSWIGMWSCLPRLF